MQEYASYLDTSRFMDMRASSRVLAVSDHHNVLLFTDVWAWVKLCLHCGGHGMSLLRGVGYKIDSPPIFCQEEVEFEKDLLTLVRLFDGLPSPEVG